MLRENRTGQSTRYLSNAAKAGLQVPRQLLIGIILLLALFAFEMFNFDTTRFALESLLGDIRFAGFAWATILAVAFCAIDFAGLARLFTPERGRQEPKEIWYLTGAWLLGATMNAVMTWWAISTVLLQHELGNEILSREQLIEVVPVFVAVLVWLTRILFIGSVTMAGERILHGSRNSQMKAPGQASRQKPSNFPKRSPATTTTAGSRQAAPVDLGAPKTSGGPRPKRVNRRPLRPRFKGGNQGGYSGMNATSKSRQ